MAKRRTRPARYTIFTPGELAAHHRDMPKTRHGHPFAPDRVPPGFHTIVDPDKHPPQPWRDLPPAPGLHTYRISLDTVLDPATIMSIEHSGKLELHSARVSGR